MPFLPPSAEQLTQSPEGNVNTSEEVGHSLRRMSDLLSLLENLEAIVGQTVERNFLPVRDGDIEHSLADVSKVRNFLAYDPKVSLKAGLLGLMK